MVAFRQFFCGMLLLFSSLAVAGAEPAGRVLFAAGTPNAIAADGGVRALRQGDPVEEGDLLVTGEGRLQILFKDNAVLALYPGTQFQIERYRYAAKGDDSDGVVLRLMKGGLRTISGLVGKRNRADYRMDSAVATIGIRGTEYGLQLGETLVGHVGEGAIEVCNAGGCLPVAVNQAFLVPSLTERPVLAQLRAQLLAPELRERRSAAKRSEEQTVAAVAAPAAVVDDEPGTHEGSHPEPADSSAGRHSADPAHAGEARADGETRAPQDRRADRAAAHEHAVASNDEAAQPGKRWHRRRYFHDEDFAKRLEQITAGKTGGVTDASAAIGGAGPAQAPAAAVHGVAPALPARLASPSAIPTGTAPTGTAPTGAGAAVAPGSSAAAQAAGGSPPSSATFTLPFELPPGLAKKLTDGGLIVPPGLLKKLR
jgi:hypothetical protein